MWWILSIVIICSIFLISFVIGYAIHHWIRHKGELALSDKESNRHDDKYILTPSTYRKREPTSGVPCTPSEPMNIQPHPKTLNSMDVLMLTDENMNNNGSLQTTPEYQIPLVSHYESEKVKKSKKNRKGSLKDSYGSRSSNIVQTPTIIISQVPDNNANFALNGKNLKPELTFSIFYDSSSKDLHVTVINASNLPVLRRFGETGRTQYFRVRVRACDTQWNETRYVCGTGKPVFNETFIVSGLVHHRLREGAIRFVVVEFEEFQNCWTVVGEASQPLIDFRANKLLKATKTLHKT